MYILIIYGLLSLIVISTVLFENKRNRKIEWAIYAIVALIFLVRFSLGQDTGAYAWLFANAENPFVTTITSHMMRNFGYTFLNYLVKITAGEFRYFVLLSNTIILGLCTYVVYKQSKNPLMSMLLFIGSGMLEVYYGSGMRQGIAMALYLFAYYKFLPKKQYLWYELFVLLAMTFQEIALVLIPVPLFYLLVQKFKEHPYRIALILSAVSWILCWFMYKYFILVEYWIIGRYGYAPSWTHLIAYIHDRTFSVAGIAMEIVFLIGMMVLYSVADKKNWNSFHYFEVLTFIYSCILYYAMAGYPLMSRASDMIQIIILVLLPRMVSDIPDLKKKLLSVAGIIVLNGALLYVDISEKARSITNKDGIQADVIHFPYITVFDKEKIDTIYED